MITTFCIVFGIFLIYSLGRSVGRAEVYLRLQKENAKLVVAVNKVEQLAKLKGENLNMLSQDELLRRIEEQRKLLEESNG